MRTCRNEVNSWKPTLLTDGLAYLLQLLHRSEDKLQHIEHVSEGTQPVAQTIEDTMDTIELRVNLG